MLAFRELAESRRALQAFCVQHFPSLLALQSGISFKLLPTEPDLDSESVHHMTTTATCLTSLLDCPRRFRPLNSADLDALAAPFLERALLRPHERWKSEGSAGVYCRCRALPAIVRFGGANDKVDEHLTRILGQLKIQPKRFAIGEADSEEPTDKWYPPNAYHTYWTLEILDLIKLKSPTHLDGLSAKAGLNLQQVREGLLLWSRQQLGYQIGLHSGSPASSVLDSDQLAWSLATIVKFDDRLSLNLESRDLLKEALKCLFSTQSDGTWRHYKPLFHYEKAGNAYCYVFETFAVLLQCALRSVPVSELFRDLLGGYCQNLLELYRYAESTKIPLVEYGMATGWGWCSGHRTNVTDPESWATASVFSYSESLRRLLGIWCREESLRALNTPRTRQIPTDAEKKIEDRGTTWGAGKPTVSELLWTLFINPRRMHVCDDRLEPDSQPIEKNQARSAILFGPPGTSKTNLVRAIADVIEWKYVELHASHFVAEGLTQVQKTADTIFKQLLELDHAVVLFDEIDELVRERDIEKDAFGRFLTTSMLPRLAELWDARKILYFVATNHINYFDSAIIRSNRFDALVLVSPPSFAAKVAHLKKLLSEAQEIKDAGFEVTEQQVQDELDKIEKRFQDICKSDTPESEKAIVEHFREQPLSDDLVLAKFALLRWDELDELANRLARFLKSASSAEISRAVLEAALKQIDDSEWRKQKSYLDFLRDSRSGRRDYQMLKVWEATGRLDAPTLISANQGKWLAKAVDSLKEIEIPGFELRQAKAGCVEIYASSKTPTPEQAPK
jgi:hypothetical protein